MFKLIRLTDTTKLVQVNELETPISINSACLAGYIDCLQ